MILKVFSFHVCLQGERIFEYDAVYKVVGEDGIPILALSESTFTKKVSLLTQVSLNQCITVTSHERIDVSNQRHNRLTTKKT